MIPEFYCFIPEYTGDNDVITGFKDGIVYNPYTYIHKYHSKTWNANKFVGPDYVDNYLDLNRELYSQHCPYRDYLEEINTCEYKSYEYDPEYDSTEHYF
jgi:hypothetical protein